VAGSKKIAVVGAGPGGLTAAMLLAARGCSVEVFEKQPYVGGRTSSFGQDGYTFDLGPTFLMMKYVLEEVFNLAGRSLDDYMTLKRIDPLYRLVFRSGKTFLPAADPERTREEITRVFPGNEEGFDRLMRREKKKCARLVPCLSIPYEKWHHLLRKQLIHALPYLDAHVSLYKHLSRFLHDPDLVIAFTFQAKYLGMSPWDCPGLFSILSYIEHALGIYHPIGGPNQITKAMAKVLAEEGGTLHLDTGVKEVLVQNGHAVGLLLESGDKVEADDVIVNADFGYAMTHLVGQEHRRKYTDDNVRRRAYSCSTYMLYLGVDRRYDIPHHNIVFAADYKRNLDEISRLKVLSGDPSFYVQNAIVTDPTLAPEGKSTIYVLVPVPNTDGDIDWERDAPAFRERVLDALETHAGLTDLRRHIEFETAITPATWEHEKLIFKGATFNLAHTMGQMLHLRPHNRFEEFDHCYLVGGGTHPGSGLPTIFMSGRIVADYILRRAAGTPLSEHA